MDLPKRTRQQKSEAHSYAILLYKLRDLGIFRNLTGNDYGIDFELELVSNDRVTARGVKIQVKSAENLRLRKDDTPSVGGVKQSTLRYWCELSFRTNVIAYAVDLESETIYITWELFWQAAAKIDGTDSSKSIEFMPAAKSNDAKVKATTILSSLAPNMADHVYAHTLALRRMKDFLAMLGDAYQYDAGTEIDRTSFHDLLEACRILLWGTGNALWKDKDDQVNWMRFAYWEDKSTAQDWDGIVCHTAKPILATLLPALIEALKRRQKQVLAAKYYFSHRNSQFLELVYETLLPNAVDVDSLIQWGNKYDYHARQSGGSYFVQQAQMPIAPKPRPSTKATGKAKPRKVTAKSSK
ncbi:DUF4365 domain-containing protein [Asticcacaulis solisilvae]|uniref:DUF4365 domain-containing protein n=1 Tax=Asticcacaulis solisilvae TaxID=1217274 RepID=UPI003FD77638